MIVNSIITFNIIRILSFPNNFIISCFLGTHCYVFWELNSILCFLFLYYLGIHAAYHKEKKTGPITCLASFNEVHLKAPSSFEL